jgi:hypothetical protein
MAYSSFSQGYNNPMADLGKGLANAQLGASGTFNKFRNNKVVSGTTDFLYSNSLVAKVSFLVLVVIMFVIALRLGSRLITWFLSPSKNPILVNGLRPGKNPKQIYQDPKMKESIPILRSVNEREGLEFTWSVWLYIESIGDPKNPNNSSYNHIFNKGDYQNIQNATNWNGTNVTGMNFPNNSPGMYLSPKTNAIVVVMNTFDNVIENVEIKDIPINKWINVVLRCQGRKMDSYINGTIVNRHVFNAVPKQNYGDVFVTQRGGFDGMLSSLRYFSHALTGVEIEELVKNGPNMTADDSLRTFPPYLALRWFFSNEAGN